MKQALKQFYDLLPAKKQLFSALKQVYIPSENIYKHLHFKSVFDVNIDKNNSFKLKHYGYQVENEIFWGGLKDGHEKISINLWISLSKRADIVLDVGANTGVYSLVTKCLNPKSKVYAFEPIKRIYNKLCENNTLNNYDIICLEQAASNETGTMVIDDFPSEHLYTITLAKNLNNSNTEVIPTAIKTIRLDDFIKSENLGKIDLIKIDVETYEAEVLQGMGKYLELFKPTILLEVHSDKIGKNIEDLVVNCNYLYFNIDDKKGLLRRTDQIKKSDYYNYLLCDEKTAKELNLI